MNPLGPRPSSDPTVIARLKERLAAIWDAAPEDVIFATELHCTEPGCPPLETVLTLLPATGGRFEAKIHKAAAEITDEDLARVRPGKRIPMPVEEAKSPWTSLAWPEDYQPLYLLLLHQQCWLWGQDIKRPEGNLLLKYGFERIRPPAGIQGSTRYQIRLSDRATLSLWGFGLYYTRYGYGGVYLNRYDATPRYCHAADFLPHVWTPADLPVTGHDPQIPYLASKAFHWIANYERWVLHHYGLSYRRACLSTWHQPSILPQSLPDEWDRLSQLSLKQK
jgi:hypothetical protein